MSNINQIKKNYASMTDDNLMQFANKERKGLTKEALAVLVQEFEIRNLDTTLFERSPAELNFDKERHWFFALEEKRKGISDSALKVSLLERELNEEQVVQILNRLPDLTYTNEVFQQLIYNKCEHAFQSENGGQVLLFIAGVMIIGYGIATSLIAATFIGAGVFISAFFMRKNKNYDGEHWYQRIVTNPESIVWIKPIVEKHTVWYVITLSKTKHIQLLTRDANYVTFTCDDFQDRKIFIDGVKKRLPHAHIGYSFDISEMYDHDPNEFINALQYENVYLPVIELGVSL